MSRTAARQTIVPLLLIGILLVAVEPAVAQRPFRVFDPYYQNETARRAFFDGYAVTAEASYRPAGFVDGGLSSGAPDPFGLAFRFDWALRPQLDLSAIVDAAGSTTGRRLQLSWVALKYYRTVDHTDYAFRLAVDPNLDALTGFPQADLAFLYTTLVTPNVSSDYALGLRRVSLGFEDVLPAALVEDDLQYVTAPSKGLEFIYTRAHGWEAHVQMQHSVLLNPARTNIFGAVQLEGGRYDLAESFRRHTNTALAAGRVEDEGDPKKRTYRGGVVWAQAGVEYNRPAYQVAPIVAVPLVQWASEESPRANLHVGFRLMLR